MILIKSSYTSVRLVVQERGRCRNMKWFIASDIHGSKYYCDKMISAYRREKADKMLLLGDILYHGPRNDLPKENQKDQQARVAGKKIQTHVFICVKIFEGGAK